MKRILRIVLGVVITILSPIEYLILSNMYPSKEEVCIISAFILGFIGAIISGLSYLNVEKEK